MFFAAVALGVMARQVIPQPFVGLLLRFRFVKVIQGLVGFLDSTKRSLNLSLGPGRRPGTILTCRYMRLPVDLQGLHHVAEHAAFGHRTIINGTAYRDARGTGSPDWFWLRWH